MHRMLGCCADVLCVWPHLAEQRIQRGIEHRSLFPSYPPQELLQEPKKIERAGCLPPRIPRPCATAIQVSGILAHLIRMFVENISPHAGQNEGEFISAGER